MDSNNDNFRVLEEYSKKNSYKIDILSKSYSKTDFRKINTSIESVCINFDKDICFYSYYDNKGFDDSDFYCGVFFAINMPKESKLRISSKNVFHRLNPFYRKLSKRSGYFDFDSEAVINTRSSHDQLHKIVANSKVRKLIIDALQINPIIRIGVNMQQNIPGIDSQSVFGIYISKKWITDTQTIDQMYAIANKIRMELIPN